MEKATAKGGTRGLCTTISLPPRDRTLQTADREGEDLVAERFFESRVDGIPRCAVLLEVRVDLGFGFRHHEVEKHCSNSSFWTVGS